MAKSKSKPTNEEVKTPASTKELTVVDLWRRNGKSKNVNRTDAVIEAIIGKIGL